MVGKISICKFLISIFWILAICNSALAVTYISLTPSITEIIYAIGAEDNLKGVSSTCDYPKEAKTKEVVGNNFFANLERIIQINPDYIFGVKSLKGVNVKHLGNKTQSVQFDFNNVGDIYGAILEIGKLTQKAKEAQKLTRDLKYKIDNIKKPEKPKKILYVVGIKPIITIGAKSFISDFIAKSGQINVTGNINSFYPQLSKEYLIRQAPDIVISTNFAGNVSDLRQIFKNAKIIILTSEQENIINRPGPRSYEAIKFFAEL